MDENMAAASHSLLGMLREIMASEEDETIAITSVVGTLQACCAAVIGNANLAEAITCTTEEEMLPMLMQSSDFEYKIKNKIIKMIQTEDEEVSNLQVIYHGSI